MTELFEQYYPRKKHHELYNITVGWKSFAEYHETELTAPICLEFLYKDKNMLYIFPTSCLTEELFFINS